MFRNDALVFRVETYSATAPTREPLKSTVSRPHLAACPLHKHSVAKPSLLVDHVRTCLRLGEPATRSPDAFEG